MYIGYLLNQITYDTMELQNKKTKARSEKYYNYLSLKNLSPEQWDELPEWEDLSQEIELLVDNVDIDY